MSYKIVRYYFARPKRVVKRGLTLKEARKWCQDPETSSRTCTKRAGIQRTVRYGTWFDGYTKEE